MKTFTKCSVLIFIMFGSLLVVPVYAADAPATSAKTTAPTKEQREKMAQAHEKLAACLRSDREVSDCHHEMMEQCKEMKGEECEHMKNHMRHEHDGHDEHASHHEHSSSSQSKAK